MKNTYKIISNICLILVILYIGSSQWIMSTNIKSKWFSLFTGPPKLQVRHNELRLSVKPECKTLEFQFSKPLDEKIKAPLPKDGKFIYSITVSPDQDWVTIKALDNRNLQYLPIVLVLSERSKIGSITKRYIKTVRIDKTQPTIPEFFHDYLVQGSSNAKLFYPFQISNLSSFLANTLGKVFVFLIVTLLLVLFLCQLLIFLISIFWQPEEAKDFFDNPEAGSALTFIDKISDRFSIPLGFLGTVVSVWYALEEPDTDYTSFIQILEIVKIAIFTTVLGLSTKILCIVRGHHQGLFSFKEKRKEQ